MGSKIANKCEVCAETFRQKGYEDEFFKILNIGYIIGIICIFILEGFIFMCGYNFVFAIGLHYHAITFCQAMIIRLLCYLITYKVIQEDLMDFSIYFKITKLMFRFKMSLIVFVVMLILSLFV